MVVIHVGVVYSVVPNLMMIAVLVVEENHHRDATRIVSGILFVVYVAALCQFGYVDWISKTYTTK